MKPLKVVLLFFGAVTSSSALANVTGNDLQNFNATTNGLDFVTVHSSKTLFPGIANFGFFTNYAVNTLPRYTESDAKQSRFGEIRDSLWSNDFNFGIGLLSNLDVGLSFPFVTYQEINTLGSRGEFAETGITEIRGNLKWRPVGHSSGGIATVLSFNYNLVENNPYMGADAGPVLNFELVFDTTVHRTAFAVNLGYRLRSPGEPINDFPIEPLGDQFIASMAVSHLFPTIDTKLIGEIYTSTPVEETSTGSNRSVSAAEFLLGAKYDVNQSTALHFGMSTEIDHGTASPDWRVYSGINYVTGYRKPRQEVQLIISEPPPLPPPKVPPRPIPTPPFVPSLPPELATQDNYPPEPFGVGDDVLVLRDVNFAFDSAHQVLPGARRTLKSLAKHLNARGYEKIIIEGHTDSIGSEAYNIQLGQRRADTIARYLIEVEGLDRSRIKVLTYGEYRPIADNGNYQGRQLNRRVVFRIIYAK